MRQKERLFNDQIHGIWGKNILNYIILKSIFFYIFQWSLKIIIALNKQNTVCKKST